MVAERYFDGGPLPEATDGSSSQPIPKLDLDHCRCSPDTPGRWRANEPRRLAPEPLHCPEEQEVDLSQLELAELVQELRRAQEQLNESHRRYRDLYDGAPVGYLTLDRDGMIRDANLNASRLLGVDRDELLDQPFSRFLTPGSIRLFLEHVRTVIEGRVPAMAELRLQVEGREFWSRLQSTPVPPSPVTGGHWQCRASLSDISDLRRARERLELANDELRASRDLMGQALASLPEPIFIMDHDMKIIQCSAAAHRVFGYRPEEMLDRPFRDLFPGERTWQEYQRRVRAAAGSQRPVYLTDFLMIRKDGSLFATDSTSIALRESGGDRPSYLAVVRDITERNRLEKLKAEFLAGVSHELRTPLAAMLGYLEAVLVAQDGLAPQQREFLETAYESGLQLSGLVDNLLDASRMEHGRVGLDLRPIHLGALAEPVLLDAQRMAAAKGVTLQAHIPPHLPTVEADPRRMGQVLRHLLHNAVKFTPVGGQVTLEMRAEAGRVQVTVSDTGIGIPEEDIPFVFDKFRRGSNSVNMVLAGTGLGLCVVRSIVEQHGGVLTVQSQRGQGTRFALWLPQAVDQRARP